MSKKQSILINNKHDSFHYKLFVVFVLIGIIYYYFFEPITLGYDYKYTVFIIVLPILIGLLFIGIYRRKLIVNKYTKTKNMLLCKVMSLYYLLQGVVFSYVCFGQLAKISWDIIQNKVASQSKEQVIYCQITSFWHGKRPSVNFTFYDRSESIKVQYSSIKAFENLNHENYVIKIKATKGLWNYYNVVDWQVEKR